MTGGTDTGDTFKTGVTDTGDTFMTGVNDTSNKFKTDAVDTGHKSLDTNTNEKVNKIRNCCFPTIRAEEKTDLSKKPEA